MDRVVKNIFELSERTREKGLKQEDIEEIKKRIADITVTSYGAFYSDPVRIAMKSLLPSSGRKNATVFFTASSASVENAAFINGTMTRYLDYNDTYLSKEALHPSDNIPPIIAMSEGGSYKGKDIIEASGVAYETVCGLSDAVSIRDRGWDHVTYVSVSSAAGLGHLLNLDQERFAHALNLSINNNISLRQTRAGELSMWKGATAANACRNSVFGTLLAESGFTGPAPIFEGEMGFFKQVSGEMNPDFTKGRIGKTMIKNYPVEYHAMSAAEVASNLKNKIEGNIESINVETFTVANTIIIKDPEKLRPKTRETADHSMPYIIAYTLTYGDPLPTSYDSKYLNDPEILRKIDLMKFRVTERFDGMYPEYLPVKISVKTDRGTYEEELEAPKGHNKKPYTWDDVMAKASRVMGEDSAKDVVSLARSFESRSPEELMEVMRNVQASRRDQ
ncbi:MmgE/PrpD family protein [Cuniculiplasma sp. SKW4]|uniref:MmgE/PrpD family protein n=1 Tax=Cuniculiplasma sp. SKW4 TaxID=3400171 RepID=UPI003FD079A4